MTYGVFVADAPTMGITISIREMHMRTFSRRQNPKQWARLALKLGVLLTDPKVWSDVNDHLSDRIDDANDAIRDARHSVRQKYDEAADRLHDARRALRGDSNWAGSLASFVGGVALGVGVGMLLAPVSGEEARATLYDIGRRTYSNASEPNTGTGGD
jgi:gas vesicle protein